MALDLERRARLLRAALDVPQAQREAFLASQSADDAMLLRQLLDLDACDELPLDRAIDRASAALPPVDEEAGAKPRYGAWRVLSKLGQGGMGSVWLAERSDGGFQQRGALKLLRLGTDSAVARARFARERDVLARLVHPDIAHLLDGGIDESGQPWFVMEYIEGSTLGDWLAGGADLRTRLRLLVRLAHAVGFAHRHLIVHRDLKPGNVMVRADGSPCLLDFGIAGLLDADVQGVATVQPLLTPDYAAPEQLRGQAVTTAADIYALGAILHELITGRRFVGSQPSISGGTPSSRATSRNTGTGRLRGDLKAIVQRATAEEPARRYASVEALADDVDRYLSGRVVTARPDSLRYRFGKLVLRNRVASALLATCLMAILASVGAALWQARAKVAEAERTRQALRQSQAVQDFILSLLTDIDPVAGRGGDTPIRALLEPARQRVLERLSTEPAVAAQVLTLIGGVYVSLGQADDARRALTSALEFNSRAAQPSLAIDGEARARLAHYDYMDGHAETALAQLDSIIVHLRPATEPETRQSLAKALGLRAHVLQSTGRGEDALKDQREALAVLRALGADSESDYVVLLVGYADLCAALGKADEALAAADTALATPSVRAQREPGLVAAAFGVKARALQALGRNAEAEPQAAATVARFAQVYGMDNPRTYYWRYRHAQILGALERLDAAQAEIDALIAHPVEDDQPVGPVAYAVLGAELAVRRRAGDAAKRVADARAAACANKDFATFCAKARALPDP